MSVIGLCRSCHCKVHRGTLAEPRTGRIYATPSAWKTPHVLVVRPDHPTGGEPVRVVNRPRKRAA